MSENTWGQGVRGKGEGADSFVDFALEVAQLRDKVVGYLQSVAGAREMGGASAYQGGHHRHQLLLAYGTE